jgi:4-hydroxy-3-polyprenylbenzoate decarboxylase
MMPLPEGMTELGVAGMLGGRRFTYTRKNGHLISAEADFCITGTVDPLRTLPEGPFGDHLGYYSMVHGNPVLKVEHVYHREGAVWPFTVVGRPPQEDSIFGELVHELTGPLIPTEIPGLKAIHAVDAAGVHPLMLAIGSERYVPYRSRKPMETLTLANALLGYGQCSLAKYLVIASHEDNPALKVTDIGRFFMHVLQRVRWQKDLHFQTCTTMDTLDYTGSGLNTGSKVVIAAAGEKKRDLPDRLPDSLSLPFGFDDPLLVMPGVITVKGPACVDREEGRKQQRMFCEHCRESGQLKEFPLIVLVDDSRFAAGNLENFLWVTFTRSDPASDIDGTDAFMKDKHWGCGDTLVIDARSKPHHAPPLEEDPDTVKKVDALGAPGGPLHGII